MGQIGFYFSEVVPARYIALVKLLLSLDISFSLVNSGK